MKEFLEALQAFGPWGVFALGILDSMGVPLPAAIDTLLVGFSATSVHSPQMAYFTALLAVLGSMGGNVALFLAARQGNRMFSKGDPPSGKTKRFREWFHRYGLLTVFVPAIVPFVPLPLKVFVISAGAFHTPISRFVVVVVIARVIRYFSLAYLGLQLGLDAKGFFMRNAWTLAGGALALSLLLVMLMRMLERRRSVET